MVDLREELRRREGVARAAELALAGISRGTLESAVRHGAVWRPRKGWYMDPALGVDVAHAFRVGGVLACVSALSRHGVWTPDRDVLHVRVPTTSARLRTPESRRHRLADDTRDDVVIHWLDAPGRAYDDPVSALAAAARCCSRREFFAILESALHRRVIDSTGIRELRRQVPARRRRLVDSASDRSESGTESLLRLALLEAGIPFRQQVFIPGVGRVDFVLGGWLIVEVDSREYHSDPTADRRRDAAASIAGYRTLRFMYVQVRYDLSTVMASIRAARLRGDHRRSVVQEIR